MNTISEVLKAAWTLIDSPEKWTQGSWARDSKGYPVQGQWHLAVSHDSSGALRAATRVYSHGNSSAFRDSYTFLEQTLHGMLGQKEFLTVYNDTHSWEDIKTLWELAIAKAKIEEATFDV